MWFFYEFSQHLPVLRATQDDPGARRNSAFDNCCFARAWRWFPLIMLYGKFLRNWSSWVTYIFGNETSNFRKCTVTFLIVILVTLLPIIQEDECSADITSGIELHINWSCQAVVRRAQARAASCGSEWRHLVTERSLLARCHSSFIFYPLCVRISASEAN